MKSVMILMAVFCLSSFASNDIESSSEYKEIHGEGVPTITSRHRRLAQKISDELSRGNVLAIAKRSNTALRAMIKIGALNLHRKGFHQEAELLKAKWRAFDGKLIELAETPYRDIGDFDPLSDEIAIFYELLEAKLGYTLCYMLRLSDIKTLNHGLRVVFKPCEYGLDEFTLHFVHDSQYRGVAPVVAYWTTVITCSVATYGAGTFFICSPLGMGVEFVMDRALAPWLAPKIYNAVCE